MLTLRRYYYYNVVVIAHASSDDLEKRWRHLEKTLAFLQNPDRRCFLWSLTSFGLTPNLFKSEKQQSESKYRFLTPDCEVHMSVQFLANASAEGFRFRDTLTNRAFCLSANGEENRAAWRFVGAMAIVRYVFRSRRHSPAPLNLRERVQTIDNEVAHHDGADDLRVEQRSLVGC